MEIQSLSESSYNKRDSKSFEISWRNCHVLCKLNGIEVSRLNYSQFKRIFPQDKIRDVITGIMIEELDLRTANGTTFPYKGWTNVIFTVGKALQKSVSR